MQSTESMAVRGEGFGPIESARSAVRWGAVIAGAVIAAAVAAMLMTAGTGLGLLSMSPWHDEGLSGPSLAVGSVIWLLISQIIAYGIGGYITGRLRTTWTDATADEIYFRDTAHGFLVWALSAVISMILLSFTAASVVSGTAKAGASMAGAGAGAAVAMAGDKAADHASASPIDYFADMLLRPEATSAASSERDMHAEVSRILTRSLATGQVSEGDQAYLTQLIAQRTGVDEATAKQRLTQVETEAKQAMQQAEQKTREAADAARKALAAFSLWAFVSLLVGAFVASFAAMMGGRARAL